MSTSKRSTVATGGPDDLGTVTITRELEAPRELAFNAFVKPEQFVQVWGPTGTHTPIESVVIEPRLGGRFESVMVADDGSGEYPIKGTFSAFVEPEVMGFVEPGSPLVSTWTFTDLGNGRSKVTIQQANVPADYRTDEGLAGFNTAVDRLESYLATVTR